MPARQEFVERAISEYQQLSINGLTSYTHRTLGTPFSPSGFLDKYDDTFLNDFNAIIDLAILSFAAENAREISHGVDVSAIIDHSLVQETRAHQFNAAQLDACIFAKRIQESIDVVAEDEFLNRLEILSNPAKLEELTEKDFRRLHMIASCMSNPALGAAVNILYALKLEEERRNPSIFQNDDNKTRSFLAILLGYDLSPIDEEWQQRREAEAKKMAEFFQESFERHRTEQAQYAQQREADAQKQKESDRLAQKDWEERNAPISDSRQRPRF